MVLLSGIISNFADYVNIADTYPGTIETSA